MTVPPHRLNIPLPHNKRVGYTITPIASAPAPVTVPPAPAKPVLPPFESNGSTESLMTGSRHQSIKPSFGWITAQRNGGEPFQVRMTITPEYAEKLLANNTENRTLKDSRVSILARDMREGRWTFNFESIMISPTGVVYDGQHRLEACVESKVPFECMVIFNATRPMRDVKDIGMVRTAADQAAIKGIPNSSRVSALAGNVIMLRENGVAKLGGGGVRPSKPMIQKELDTNGQKLQDALVFGYRLCAPAVLDFCNYAFREKDQAAAARFMQAVLTGESIVSGSSVYALRQKLIRNIASPAKLGRIHLIAFFFKAFDSFLRNRPCKILSWTEREAFPEF